MTQWANDATPWRKLVFDQFGLFREMRPSLLNKADMQATLEVRLQN